ncbi:MAG: hypothetical protein V7L22_27295 [Nostoc sp.]|uniref:hypothetical protein n=1 Tax=Nostoc sp. TaxID=1180 RepID=UPI002FF45CDC
MRNPTYNFLQHFSLATPLRVRSLYNCDIYNGRSCGTLCHTLNIVSKLAIP